MIRACSSTESIESVLNGLITEIELQASKIRLPIKRKLEDSTRSTKKRRLTFKETSESEERNCRICYDSNSQLPIIFPCKCKGTIGAIHLKCLEHWLEESNRNTCELCGYRFLVERTPRYRALRSIPIWLCLRQDDHQIYARNLRGDILRCLIITPIILACSYICIVAADFYAMHNYENFPPARWTTYPLLSIMLLLIFSYFVWMYMAIQYYQKVWFYWWQKTSTVKLILPLENNSDN